MVSKINMKSEIFNKTFSLFFAEGADSAPDRQQSQRARGEQRGVGRPLQALPAALLRPSVSASRRAMCDSSNFKVPDEAMPADFLTKWVPKAKLRTSIDYATNARARKHAP